MKFYKLPASLLFTHLLIACGQQGPLYMPGEEPPIHVEPEEPLQEQEITEER
jgi:predicted small lipoprotein YifL